MSDASMSSTSPEDGALGAGPDWGDNSKTKEGARPPPRKRRRIVISCTECHRRKQKCDRKFPCTNCVSRSKEDACQYETGAPTAKKHGRLATGPALSSPEEGAAATTTKARGEGAAAELVTTTSSPSSALPTNVATFAGYSHAGANNTLNFLHRIETATTTAEDGVAGTAAASATSVQSTDPPATRDRYRGLIRQLPPRPLITALAAIYFRDFNWHYAVLDHDIFHAQLGKWYSLPLAGLLLTHGPGALGREMAAFPAVVFQLCAVALLTLDDCPGQGSSENGGDGDGEGLDRGMFESLKYAGGMTFEDLAREYSECGVEVAQVLGKRGMGLNTVVAGWVRGGWLKYVGLVTESWHAIGSAIRDAQEIGMHRDSLDPKPAGEGAEAALENQWEVQRRRKVWMTLALWDIHMACVLGRPTTINLGMAPPSLPVDAPDPKDRARTPVLPRREDDPPTPLTRALWACHLMRPLKDILELEKEGPCPKDFERVDRVHNELLELDARTPAYFRLENPDTRFDALPECDWLPLARVILPQLSTFELMALHRPYIFTRPKSRTEALKASLDMLHVQRLHFMALKPQMYKTFTLFFGTFDAIVLMASIYILFPKEHPDLVRNALQHFHWAVERFEAMSARNSLAKAALGVLHAIYLRLKRSLGISSQAAQRMLVSGSSSTSPASGAGSGSSLPSLRNGSSTAASSFNQSPTTSSKASIGAAVLSMTEDELSPPQHAQIPGTGYPPPPSSSATLTSASSGPTPEFNFNLDPELFPADPDTGGGAFDWNPPSDFDWSSLQPIYATSDLVYHDLVGTGPRVDRGAGPAWGYPGPQQHQQQHGYGLGAGMDADGGGQKGGIGMGMTCAAAGEEERLPGFCQFGGDFAGDSVWSLLNQYTPF